MVDAHRVADRAGVSDTALTKRPWRTPVVIAACADDTEKPFTFTENLPTALPSLIFGPS
jgi:hypothetical protein